MIEPTIGRVVLFNDGTAQRVPASICFVHPNGLINIGGFNEVGIPFNRTGVTLRQDDEICLTGDAEWMPYQKGQAKKTEELEEQIAEQTAT